MAVLYLTEQGATLKKKGDLFAISKDGQTLEEIPAIKVDQVIVFGNVNLTTPVIRYLLKQGIDCVFCSSYGRYHGRLFSTESKFGTLRQQQLQANSDPSRKLAIAKAVIEGKLLNQRTILLRYARERKNNELSLSCEVIWQCIKKIEQLNDINSLLGLEGYASASYFQAFKLIIKNDFGFDGRARRPPPDPVNSLLSFGYTLLTYDIQSAVHAVGLDPFIGFLHSTQYSRPSLALDLVEEFRTVIVDSVVLKLINSQIMNEHDFNTSQKGKAVFLTQEGIKTFIHHYEGRVQTAVIHPADKIKVTYRRSFELQARHIERTILAKEPRYQPFLIK
ncbi:MAG: CRISPR-associated endonuclease Cas1 [Chloroflexota bacterium]|nr:CRISPR-associated endonuclease Cas1 [Chloroflexota bacterium]